MVIGVEREQGRVATARRRAKTFTDNTTDSELTPTDTANSGAVIREESVLMCKISEVLMTLPRGRVTACYLSIQLTISDTADSKNGLATLIDELIGVAIIWRVMYFTLF